jgi:hypothetical protein
MFFFCSIGVIVLMSGTEAIGKTPPGMTRSAKTIRGRAKANLREVGEESSPKLASKPISSPERKFDPFAGLSWKR